jgi:hypothetical protein
VASKSIAFSVTGFLVECYNAVMSGKRGGGRVWKSQSGGVDDFLEGTRSQVFSRWFVGPKDSFKFNGKL